MRRPLVVVAVVLALVALGRPDLGAQETGKQSVARQSAGKPAPAKGDRDAKAAAAGLTSSTVGGLQFRSIGPAVTSGRVIDIAVSPAHANTWYVATVGGAWRTENAGTSWTPIFDEQGSFSIGCVTVDPNDANVVWVGTGENNSQRSVSYGDGVYRSADGGKTWENTGLKGSMHVGKILVDPGDSNVVYVAALGPLWSAGGERGVYKTADGGKTWKQALKVSDDTGVSDLSMDPRDPKVLYAAAYQRRRHVWTLINGGPESALYKTTDGGETWKRLENGLPKEDLGRIGLAVSPADPDVVYAIVEAANGAGGFFRSKDRGASWEKMSGYVASGPMYYNEIVADPADVDRVYSMDVYMQVTDDGGRTFRNAGEKWKHVDNHALWIDPNDADHLVNGNDGGVYESFDRAATWAFKANLPITQFYRVEVDTSSPFYYVYGGTQDNTTLGGPSRTSTEHGITNDQWFVTTSGDGFVTRVDPKDPNVVYSESQHGGLVRYDRRTGEQIDIQPQAGKDDPPLRWNWDSPLIISPHSHTRLYFAAQRLFRSDDRGNSWKPVSSDLTRQIDRNALEVMGRVWSVDAVAKNSSTSFYGNIVSLAESPRQEGLIYAGTDDGLVQVTEDGGSTWRKIEKFPGVPEMTYVSRLEASPTDAGTVYAAFNNHKMGDLKPYVLKSTDRGRTWTSIAGDLPARGSVWVVVQDREQPGLLFAGTEFGVFFTVNGGGKWVQLKGGLPTIAVRDIAIQQREQDLVLATFGRGFYVLDDYTPLRRLTPDGMDRAALLPVRNAWMFIPSLPYGWRGKGFLGESFYAAPNPPFGAVLTYYLKENLQTGRQARRELEKKIAKEGGDVRYPTWEALRAEDREEAPAMVLTVADEAGNVVRRLTGPVTAGFHRVAWDLRYAASNPASLETFPTDDPFSSPPAGPLAAPGTYTVTLAQRVAGKLETVGEPQRFEALPLGTASLPDPDRAGLLEFQQKTARLQRAVLGASQLAGDLRRQLSLIKKAVGDAPAADTALMDEVRALEGRVRDIQLLLNGDSVVRRYNEPTPASIVERVQGVVGGHWTSTSAATETHRQSYATAAEMFAPVLEQLRSLTEVDMKALNDRLEAVGAPWTPGRVPRWEK